MARKRELAEFGEAALEQLRGPVATEFRRRFESWRDPRARLLRKRRRAGRAAATGATTVGVFGASAVGTGLAATSSTMPVELLWDISTVGFGGIAVLGGAFAVRFGAKYRRLRRTPLPDTPAVTMLPPLGSAARSSMQRLRDAEHALYAALAELTSAGAGSVAAEARATADHTAGELRRGAQRLIAVEGSIRHAPAAQKEQLRSDVERLRGELDEGVDGYGALVAAAGQAVAASGSVERTHLLQDATDRLAGLAGGMREVFGDPGAGPTTGSPELRG